MSISDYPCGDNCTIMDGCVVHSGEDACVEEFFLSYVVELGSGIL